jgi:riboflavin synthase
MFTGLIRFLGTLQARNPRPGGARLRIAAPSELLERTEIGSSICTNGACLTAVALGEGFFEADLSEETLLKTTLGRLSLASMLNLEPSLCVGDPVDGHLVSGHVDGVGCLLDRAEGEGFWRFSMPAALAPMLAPKGSVAVDGISLTLVECGSDWFSVALIPETVRATRLQALRSGDEVNVEVDPIGRYVARAMTLRASDANLAAFAREGWGRG